MPATAQQPSRTIRFGRFEADLGAGRLRKNGRNIKLQDQPFRLLSVLLERPGEVVTREELRQQLWSDGTFVDFAQGLAAAINRVRKALGDRPERPRFVETVPRRGYRFVGKIEAPALEGVDALVGVAVLPFANISPNAEDEYFSDGLTEELIHALTKVKGLRITSRTSAFAFKGKGADVREVADKLKVEIVLEGSVRKDGEKLRVTAQLVNAVADFHLWSRVYERKFEDVFRIQEDIARAIVKAVCTEVAGEPPKYALAPVTENLEAYSLYLKGRHFWSRRDREGLQKGLEYFKQAIATDPAFAIAHAGLADSYTFLAVYTGDPASELISKADAEACEALRIDEDLAEAHLSLGTVRVAEHNFPAAHKAFQRAWELNPGLARSHHFYAMTLAVLGRFDEAIAEIRQALALDPLAPTANQDAGRILYFAGRYDEAIEHFRNALEIQSNMAFTQRYLGLAYLQKGMFGEALAEFGSDSALAAVTSALMGKSDAAKGLLVDLKGLDNRKHFSEALLYVALGRHGPAIAALEAAYKNRRYNFSEHHDQLLLLGVDPFFAPLRSIARFDRFVRLVRTGE